MVFHDRGLAELEVSGQWISLGSMHEETQNHRLLCCVFLWLMTLFLLAGILKMVLLNNRFLTPQAVLFTNLECKLVVISHTFEITYRLGRAGSHCSW